MCRLDMIISEHVQMNYIVLLPVDCLAIQRGIHKTDWEQHPYSMKRYSHVMWDP